MINFENSALVVAHLDDEILWFSSILENVDKIIIVFKGTNNKTVFYGRDFILNSKVLPYAKKITCLEIEESDAFNSSNWKMPKPTEYGVKNNSITYKENYFKVRNKLIKNLVGFKNVITHNPWGEYGHEEHAQVFRVIMSLLTELNYSIWVSGYFSERSYNMMSLFKKNISKNFVTCIINKKFCESIKSTYIENGAWTWSNDYNWPQSEIFYELFKTTKNLEISSAKTPQTWDQMNFILMFEIHLNYFSKIRSKVIRFLQLFIPKIFFNILVKNYKKIKFSYSQTNQKVK
jgi:hypothetical protein